MSSKEGKTIIEPVGSRFREVSTILDYSVKGNIEGVDREKKLDSGRLKKFPGTNQTHRPEFNGKKGKFVIKKEDGTDWTQHDLDILVKEVPIRYDETYIDRTKWGQVIEKANIKDCDDPYINSKEWRVEFKDGERTLSDNTYKENYMADMLRGNSKFAIENETGAISGDTEYILKRPDLAESRKTAERDQVFSATDLYRGMFSDRKKLLAVLRMFNVDIDPHSDIKELQNKVWDKADDNATTERGTTYQKQFIKYASMPDAELQLRQLIALGALRGQISPRAGLYEFQGTPIGSTYDELYDYFNNANNSGRLDGLKILLEEK